MFKKLKSVISVVFSLIKFALIKCIRFKEFSFYPIERVSPDVMINIYRGGRMILGKKVRVHSGSKLSAVAGGTLSIGDNTALNYNCIIVARESVRIGNGVVLGPNVMIYDHDHDFRNDPVMNGSKFTSGSVEIGDNTWIGAGTVILKGTRIGKNCVIGAGSVIHGDIPDGHIAVQKRVTTLSEIVK